MGQVNITVNKNASTFDPEPPNISVGIRLGTAAVTSRGFGPDEMKRIAQLISKVLSNSGDEKVLDQVRQEVNEINGRFPTPGIDQ